MKKRFHDYSKIVKKIDKKLKELKVDEEGNAFGGFYIAAHDGVIQYNTLYSLRTTIRMMQWEK